MHKFVLTLCVLLCMPFLYSQPSEEMPGSETSIPEPSEGNVFLNTLALDILTSDYYALVSWVRSLGLPETGTIGELRAALYAHYGVSAPPAYPAAGKTVIIESANKTEYLSAKGEGDSIIKFTGGVSIIMKDDSTGESHLIRADEIVYNKDLNLMSARGHIVYERKKADGSDFFMGELMEIDLDEWSGLFLDGKSRNGTETEKKLTFEAKDIVRRGESVLVFKDGIITNGDNPEKYFSIRASRIWILGGNEWAVLNATLSVGELPVLYLPFFYYPGEEIVFHPVFGYRDREGRFVQTTTYLAGDKPEKAESISLFKLTDGAKGYARRVDGVFLRTTREKKGNPSGDVIKIFLDIYTNLGAYAGIQAKISELKPFQAIDAHLGIAYSRSVFPLDATLFSPFVMENDLQSIWNVTNLFGVTVPFRFSFNLASRFAVGPVSVSFALPFAGDPWFDRDFKQRSEDMEWLQFMKKKETGTVPAKIASFTDKVDISASIPVSSLSPWLSALTLTKLNTSLSWIGKAGIPPLDATELLFYKNNPGAEFFLPDSWKLLDTALSLSGTLFEYPLAGRQKQTAAAAHPISPDGKALPAVVAPVFEEPLPGLLMPWSIVEPPSSNSEAAVELFPDFTAPGILNPLNSTLRPFFALKLLWQANPSFSLDRRYNTAAWSAPELLDWQLLYETQASNVSGNLTLNAAFFDSLARLSITTSASTRRQIRPIVLEDPLYVSSTLLDTWKRQDAQVRADSISTTIAVSSSPFQDIWFFAPTTLSWNIALPLYDYSFASMVGNEAVYKTQTVEWTKERLKTHNLTATLAILPFGFNQSLTVRASLPPLLPSYGMNLSLKFPLDIVLASGTVYAKTSAEKDFSWDPLTISITGGKNPFLVSSNSAIYSIVDKRLDSLVNKLVWDGLSAELVSKYTPDYNFASGTGWTIATNSQFRLSDMTIAYNKQWTPILLWKNRISAGFTLSSDVKQSFLRVTDSSMSFSPSLTFKIYEFLDISFSSTSRNASSWQYYKDLFDLPEPLASLKQVDPFLDILHGFDFFNPDKTNRQSSLFKLKSLSVKVVHYLSDWDLTFDFSAMPFLNTSTKAYEFRNSVSFLIAWRGVPEIKTQYKQVGEDITW